MSDFKMFDVLTAADSGNYSYPDEMDQEQRTEFERFTQYPALRWMSGASDQDTEAIAVQVANAANLGWWELHEHPKLRWLLLCSVGLRERVFRRWPKIPGQTSTYEEKLAELIWPRAKPEEIEQAVRLFTKEQLEDRAQRAGVQDDDLKKLKAAEKKKTTRKKK